MIVERVRSGMAKAKANGTKSGKAIGRPRNTSQDPASHQRGLRCRGCRHAPAGAALRRQLGHSADRSGRRRLKGASRAPEARPVPILSVPGNGRRRQRDQGLGRSHVWLPLAAAVRLARRIRPTRLGQRHPVRSHCSPSPSISFLLSLDPFGPLWVSMGMQQAPDCLLDAAPAQQQDAASPAGAPKYNFAKPKKYKHSASHGARRSHKASAPQLLTRDRLDGRRNAVATFDKHARAIQNDLSGGAPTACRPSSLI